MNWSRLFAYSLLAAIAICLLVLCETYGVVMFMSGGVLEFCAMTLWLVGTVTSVLMSACYLMMRDRKYYLADIPCERKDRIWIVAILFVMWPFLLISCACMLRYKRREWLATQSKRDYR